MRLPILFLLITVMLDAMGIGLIMPIMPDLIREAAVVHWPTLPFGAG